MKNNFGKYTTDDAKELFKDLKEFQKEQGFFCKGHYSRLFAESREEESGEYYKTISDGSIRRDEWPLDRIVVPKTYSFGNLLNTSSFFVLRFVLMDRLPNNHKNIHVDWKRNYDFIFINANEALLFDNSWYSYVPAIRNYKELTKPGETLVLSGDSYYKSRPDYKSLDLKFLHLEKASFNFTNVLGSDFFQTKHFSAVPFKKFLLSNIDRLKFLV